MFFEINKSLCECFGGLDPIKLLNYPAADVFDLINNMISYNDRQQEIKKNANRKPAGDNWF